MGREKYRVQPGQEIDFRIAADPERLQRIAVGGRRLLVYVPPGARLSLVDDPCTFWRLEGPLLDSNEINPPDAYCVRESDACRAGFDDGDRPRLARDPLCGDAASDVKRCVRLAEVRARPAVELEVIRGDEHRRLTEHYQPAHWIGCVPTTARDAHDTVELWIGPGERWTLFAAANGLISGTHDRGSSATNESFDAAVAELRASETWCRGARTLARLGDQRAIVHLAAALRSRAEADKLCLLDALEALGAEAYARSLVRSGDAGERAVGLRLMESFPSDEQIALLVDVALDDRDAELRRAAATTLALQRRTPAWLAATARLLDADDKAVRRAAIDSMAMQQSDAIRQALTARLARERDPELVAKLRAAIAPRK